MARVCSFKNFLLFFQAPKKGNPDDNATCQDFVKASGKEVTWVTEKDLEGMEETYKSLPKEEKKKMNFERPKKKDLEKSEVFALKSKSKPEPTPTIP